MSTRTVVGVVAVLAAAIIVGAVIWAVSDDETTREAALRPTESPVGPTTYRITGLPDPPEFPVSSYAVGMTSAAGRTTTTTTTDKYATASQPLRFSKPLDEVSLKLFQEARLSRLQQKVTLELRRQREGDAEPGAVMRYEFSFAVVGTGNEAAEKGDRSRQHVDVFFRSMAIDVPSPQDLGYATAEGAVGYLRIPGRADVPEEGYVAGYSWGWENSNAPAIASGATTTGKLIADSVTIRRQLDIHAPYFWQHVINGTTISELELHLAQPHAETGLPSVYTRYKLQNVKVVSVQDSGGEIPMQEIKLDFATIELEVGQNSATLSGGTKTG